MENQKTTVKYELRRKIMILIYFLLIGSLVIYQFYVLYTFAYHSLTKVDASAIETVIDSNIHDIMTMGPNHIATLYAYTGVSSLIATIAIILSIMYVLHLITSIISLKYSNKDKKIN